MKRGALNESDDKAESHQCIWGKSQAYMRYVHFANQAEIEKLNNVARLVRAIAHAEYIHAGDHFRELKHLDGGFVVNSMAVFGPGDTKKNLKLAIAGETFLN